ncbi:PTS glucitol/sorbitol transporter subunit IIA [Staphylococcus shinii]|uniref:PTS glucitol/sorbitol transporter subunit IIA n=2 Tax=Staphylococcus shinii TaxID=2912228 RepID=UPI000D1DC2A2|nr:PTS glucitol/sorbitol transporter subunit IIA [Staphylococcus shinii]PTH96278.1 PTS sorbitol transporter subunit IIA [Staphylococcus shinii]PTI63365.1 PTS sorbitol transporter subunit IIA [Staphylococcus shinii]
MYKTIIKDFGSIAPVFKEDNLFVLFGTSAPDELKDISYIHETEEISDDFSLNSTSILKINDIEFRVDKVGSEAHNNLMTLGHISVYLNKEDILPGAVAISGNELPDLDKGDILTFK